MIYNKSIIFHIPPFSFVLLWAQVSWQVFAKKYVKNSLPIAKLYNLRNVTFI